MENTQNGLEMMELSNEPREVTVNGLTFKVRRLKIKEIFSYFQAKICANMLQEAKAFSNILEGEDKRLFLIDAWKNLPTGTELTNKTADHISSIDGIVDILYLASKDYNETDVGSIKDVIDIESLELVSPIINWITGMANPEATTKQTKSPRGTKSTNKKKGKSK